MINESDLILTFLCLLTISQVDLLVLYDEPSVFINSVVFSLSDSLFEKTSTFCIANEKDVMHLHFFIERKGLYGLL